MERFELHVPYQPAGDQPKAIRQLVRGLREGKRFQTLLGVTGSGKTFTIANVIQQVQRPTLIISHNKTLAAQLYSELKQLFPNNAVEYFISYYDYYQPEAYIPETDTYIEKDIKINEEIDRLRLKATSALVEGRRDVIVVASVSCIYGIGSVQSFKASLFPLRRGMQLSRRELLYRLSELYYERNDGELRRGSYRVRGDIVDIMPAYENTVAIRVEFFGDEIDRIRFIDTRLGETLEELDTIAIHPARIFVTTRPELEHALKAIEAELRDRLKELYTQGKVLEAQRLEQRTLFDLEMMREIGYCSGIENYSMYLTGRTWGERPACLIDYFPEDFLMIIDESHVTIPQIRAMYNGDRQRKLTLVEHGFRLPSALENRPLRFDEFESLINQCIFVSATPGDYELEKCGGEVVEQIVRPTGLLDPLIEVRPLRYQIDDLISEIHKRVQKQQRVLVITLTKRMAEDLAEYLQELNIRSAYLHSEIDALERVEIIRDFRLGKFDVLIGINLLREGLDLPEVSLVAILDADKEGFLRSERSLFQIAGRTARNAEGMVILYADRITDAMRRVIEETKRRRKIQEAYNRKHRIVPRTIYKTREEILQSTRIADIQSDRMERYHLYQQQQYQRAAEPLAQYLTPSELERLIQQLEQEMEQAAREWKFELAAELRDEIARLKALRQEMA